jgi:hypothetical protein
VEEAPSGCVFDRMASQCGRTPSGWVFEGNFLVSKSDGSRAGSSLVQGSLEYNDCVAACHEHLESILLNELGFVKHELPVGGTPTTSVYCSPHWSSPATSSDSESRVCLVLIMGKGESRAPAWVTRVCLFQGLHLGSMLPYCRGALSRGWDVMILNPNVGAVIVELPLSKGSGVTTGPAPPELVAGIADFGFSQNAAHRAALGSCSTELERCGNWIFEHMDHTEHMDEPLPEKDMRCRVVPVEGNENAVAHTQYVFRHMVLPKLNGACAHACAKRSRRLLVAGTSYAGFSCVRLLEAMDEVREHLLAMAIGDSSHFIDCDGAITEVAAGVLEARSRNYVPHELPVGTPVVDGSRFHMPAFSAGVQDHGWAGRVPHAHAMGVQDDGSGPLAERRLCRAL